MKLSTFPGHFFGRNKMGMAYPTNNRPLGFFGAENEDSH